jgi:hypothetical protein
MRICMQGPGHDFFRNYVVLTWKKSERNLGSGSNCPIRIQVFKKCRYGSKTLLMSQIKYKLKIKKWTWAVVGMRNNQQMRFSVNKKYLYPY